MDVVAPPPPKSISMYSTSKKKKKKKKEASTTEASSSVSSVSSSPSFSSSVVSVAEHAELAERAGEYRRQAGQLRAAARAEQSRAELLRQQLAAAETLLAETRRSEQLWRETARKETAQGEHTRRERDAAVHTLRTATVEAAQERERLAAIHKEALSRVEELGRQMLELEGKNAELASKLDASRRECEGLRGRVVDSGTLAELQQDKGASASLKLIKQELERTKEQVRKLEAKADETKRRLDEAETQLRLEKAARADEARLARDKAAAAERTEKRLEEALKSQTDRSESLSKDKADLVTRERAANDEKLKLAARVRALESAAKSAEEAAQRMSDQRGSKAGGGSGGGEVELLRVDVAHAERKAAEAEKRERIAEEELMSERRARESAELAATEALRRAGRLEEEKRLVEREMERREAAAMKRAEEAEQRAAKLEEKLASADRRREDEEATTPVSKRAGRSSMHLIGEETEEKLRAALELAENRARRAEELVSASEMRLERSERARENAEKERDKTIAELREQLANSKRDLTGGADEKKAAQHQREITLLNEQLNTALRDAANAKLALRMRDVSASPASPGRMPASPLATKSSPSATKALPAPADLLGAERRQFKKLMRAGKDAKAEGDFANALTHFQAAALLAYDEKLQRTIEKLEKQNK